MYGCDRWVYTTGRAFKNQAIHKRDHADCNHPAANGWIAALFCVTAVVFGAQVLLTLFIGSKRSPLIITALLR